MILSHYPCFVTVLSLSWVATYHLLTIYGTFQPSKKTKNNLETLQFSFAFIAKSKVKLSGFFTWLVYKGRCFMKLSLNGKNKDVQRFAFIFTKNNDNFDILSKYKRFVFISNKSNLTIRQLKPGETTSANERVVKSHIKKGQLVINIPAAIIRKFDLTNESEFKEDYDVLRFVKLTYTQKTGVSMAA